MKKLIYHSCRNNICSNSHSAFTCFIDYILLFLSTYYDKAAVFSQHLDFLNQSSSKKKFHLNFFFFKSTTKRQLMFVASQSLSIIRPKIVSSGQRKI